MIFYSSKCIIDREVNVDVNICKEFIIKTWDSILLTFKNKFTGQEKKNDKKRKLRIESMSSSIVVGTLVTAIQVTDHSTAALLFFRLRLFIMLVAYAEKSEKFILSKSLEILTYKEKKLAISAFAIIEGIFHEVFTQECYIRGVVYVYKYLSVDSIEPISFYLEFLASIMIDVIGSNNETNAASITLHIGRLSKTIDRILTSKNNRSKLCTWYFTRQFELWSRVVATLDSLYKHPIILHSITQLMFGITRFSYSAQIIFFQHRLANFLGRLAEASGRHIPIISLLLECLQFKLPISSRDVMTGGPYECILKTSYGGQAINQITKNIIENLSMYVYHPAFLGYGNLVMIRLLRFFEKTPTPIHKQFVGNLVTIFNRKVSVIKTTNKSIIFNCKHKILT